LTWINLQNETSLVGMIKKIDEETKNRTYTLSDPDSVFGELAKYIQKSMQIKDLTLVYYQTCPWTKYLHKDIKNIFNKVGNCPRLIYWNLCQNIGTVEDLPGPINKKNCILLSGQNASLVKCLYIKKKTTYETIEYILNNIKIFNNVIEQE
jgi:hypothetical protein